MREYQCLGAIIVILYASGIRCTTSRHCVATLGDAHSPSWNGAMALDDLCYSAVAGGGTVMCPTGSSSCRESSRARVSSQ